MNIKYATTLGRRFFNSISLFDGSSRKELPNVRISELKEKAVSDTKTRRKLAMLKRSGLFSEDLAGVTISRACDLEDLTAAYRLVHNVFAESGFIQSESSNLRVRLFEMTLAMATFVAKANGRVVGVLSIVGDSPEFGLPSDAAFKEELTAMRLAGARLCEVTNQAVAEDYRKSALATELMRCAMAHTIKKGYDENVAAVSPSHNSFYKLLNFREIGSKRSYSQKLDDPVVALSMNVNQYRRPPCDLNEAEQFIRHFLVEGNPFMCRVKAWADEARRAFLNPQLLQELFVIQTNSIAKCSPFELEILRAHWGPRLFSAVTGRSFATAMQEWITALLCQVDTLDFSWGFPVERRLSVH